MDLENFYKTTAINLVDMIQSLKCPICLDIIVNVRELPCRHIFCNDCIERYGEGKGKIVCPLCKQELLKRMFLNRDAGFDSICYFTKNLFKELKEHKIDGSSLYLSINALKDLNLKDGSESVEIIPQSSEDNDIIPCTVKHKENKAYKITKENQDTKRRPLKIKCAEKKKKLILKKIDVSEIDKKLSTAPKILTKSYELKKQSRPVLRKRLDIEKHVPQLSDNKSKILQWLHDTRNKFERFSQTQNNFIEKSTSLDFDMPSVSQLAQKGYDKCPITKRKQENERKGSKCRRARSAEHLDKLENKYLKRHSLECSTPSKLKQYQNSNEMESIENKLIIHFMEDEVLDAIDKKVSEDKNVTNKPLGISNRNNSNNDKDIHNAEILAMVENEFLGQLDNDSDKDKMKTHKEKKISKTGSEKNFKSSWKSISHFKKSIRKCKVPRKLNISLQSTQKHGKKNSQVEIKGSHETIVSNNSVIKCKTVDFQKMEDYFCKVIPEMIKNNVNMTSQEISGEIEPQPNFESCKIPQENSTNLIDQLFNQKKCTETDNNSDRSESDIYIYHTQPLCNNVDSPTFNKIEYAFEIAKKLETILNSDKKEMNANRASFNSTFQIIKNIYENFNVEKEVIHGINASSQTSDTRIMSKIFTEKEIQTDVFSLDGFNITPTAAFKSFNYEDKDTQTDNFCVNCPHIDNKNLLMNDKGIVLPTDNLNFATMKRISDPNKKTSTSSLDTKLSKESIPLNSEVLEDENYSLEYKSGSQVSLKNATTLTFPQEKLNENMSSNNLSQHKMSAEKVNESEMPLEEILKGCHTQFEPNPNFIQVGLKNISTSQNPSLFKSSKEKFSTASEERSTKGCQSILNSKKNDLAIWGQKTEGSLSQNTSFRDTSVMKMADKKYSNSNSSKIDLTPDSAIIYSLNDSKSRVNRKLMFEKAIKNRSELAETLKRVRTGSSNLESEEEGPNKVICNRFLQEDLSIDFESESVQCTQHLAENDQVTQGTKGHLDKKASVSCTDKLQKNDLFDHSVQTKPLNDLKPTQTESLLIYCDELIAKANKQIFSSDEPMVCNQILTESSNNKNKKNIVVEKVGEKFDVMEHEEVKTLDKFDKIKTQDLLRHYDNLIEKANKQIGINENVKNAERIKYATSQKPTTSKVFNESASNAREISQYNLDQPDVLVKKPAKSLSNKVLQSVGLEKSAESQLDDEFFCQNLDKLDSVVENANENKNKIVENKYSESLFESYKDTNREKESENEKEKRQLNNITENNCLSTHCEIIDQCTPKRRHSDSDNKQNLKKIKVLQNIEIDNENNERCFGSSDDEIFSDIDVVETTPQKEKNSNFLDRLGCSQALNRSSRTSNVVEIDSLPQFSIDIVPPPPGFEDEEIERIKKKSSEVQPISQRESENIIPNSLSPKKSDVISNKKPLKSSSSNSKTEADLLDIPHYFDQFTDMSPICEKKTNLNVIEMVHQSKFSPLTILPKAPTTASSPLTSTPKQKSILSYVTQNRKAESLRLNRMEVTAIRSLCSKDLASHQDKFGPEVTHMIVSTDKNNHLKDHTIKFISAVAAGLWVLNFKWIQDCLAQNKIVEEEQYEVLDISGVPSPRISRLSRLTNPLFKGFKFWIEGPFSQTSVQEIENVIKLLSGVVVPSMKHLQNNKDYISMIIAEGSETEDLGKYEAWLETYKSLTIDINWLSLSVSRYKVLSFKPYLLCAEDILIELGYPQDLLVDVPSSFTQQNTACY